ncbi:hypothetical protein GDO86_018656, partial [Hymenochirus boettgeri]
TIDPLSSALVTLGSSKDMLFEGGPKPWVLEPVKFFRNTSSDRARGSSLSLVESPLSRGHIQHWVRASCQNMGEQIISLTVGNKPTETNPYPAVETISVKLICAPPSRFALTPFYKHSHMDLICPLMQQNKQVIPVSNYRDQLLELWAFDHQDRKFDNFSSLAVAWDSSRSALASFDVSKPMELIQKEDGSGQRKLHGLNTVYVHQMSGTAVITARAGGYNEDHLRAAKVRLPYEALTPVSTSLDLLLVEDVKVNLRPVSIYPSSDVTAEFTISEGSGYFFINRSSTHIANTEFKETQWHCCGEYLLRGCNVYPLHPGSLTVMVYDLCLAFPAPATVGVHVSDIYQVDVRVVDKVEIGKWVKAYVRVLDSSKKPFLAKYLAFMDLELGTSSPVVLIKAVNEKLDDFTAVFAVHGVAIGQTSLTAVAVDRVGSRIDSSPKPLEVFPPFRLLPRKITLIIGATMQITSEGGPQPRSNILFSITDERIVSISANGCVKGVEVGNGTVTGVVQAVDAESGKVVTVSEDTVEVEVVHLRAVRISAPITRMKVGTQMPVYVMGISSSQTPFSFGNAVPGLTFHWAAIKRDFIDVRSRHDEASIGLPSQYNLAMNVYAKMKGKTGLKVTVKVTDPTARQFHGGAQELSDEIQIQVYDGLHLLTPHVDSQQILMAPNSNLKLHTNRDRLATVTYRILSGPNSTAVAHVDEKGWIRAGPIAGVCAMEINSQEHFGINQTITVSVKVSPVSYLQVVTSPALRTGAGNPLSAIPLGITLSFSVEFHDSTGEIFHSHNSLLGFATNRDDFIHVGKGPKNNTFLVRTENVGLTIFSVWDVENPGIADYVPLPVQYSVASGLSGNAVVGDIICFSCPVTGADGSSGIWSSSSNSLLQIEPKTGVALAKEVGLVTVYYEIPGLLRTYREWSVQVTQLSEWWHQPVPSPATHATNVPPIPQNHCSPVYCPFHQCKAHISGVTPTSVPPIPPAYHPYHQPGPDWIYRNSPSWLFLCTQEQPDLP